MIQITIHVLKTKQKKLMKTILVFNGNQPCLDISTRDVPKNTPNYGKKFGLNRDRNPDTDWPELRNTSLECAKEVEFTDEIKQILLEDLAYIYGSNSSKFSVKLKEFNLSFK